MGIAARSGGNLPAPRASLIGRERDTSQIRDLIRYGGERLLTLTGTGGCGKTRLALEVAAGVRDTFRDGIWLVELAGIADTLLIPEVVAAAIDMPEPSSDGITDSLIANLLGQQALILLDNCEHVIDACANLADILLSACPGLNILATSREPLKITGERLFPVHPLESPPSGGSLSVEDLALYPAVQLFVARACLLQPGFRLVPENASTVARICTILGGIPLALELAAARTRVLSPSQILARLGDFPQLLADRSRSVAPRHRTLTATLDWSYGLLSQTEQAAFRRLSLPVGRWSVGAAEAVCTGGALEAGDVLDVITRLVEKSLVTVELRAGEARYSLLEPVRQYGCRLIAENGELEATSTRLAEYYLTLAEQAERKLGESDQAEWLRRLDGEIDGIRAVLRWADARGHGEVTMRMVTSLCWYFYMRHLREGLRWLGASFKHEGITPARVRAKAMNVAATMCELVEDYHQGIKYCNEALLLHQELGDMEGLSYTKAALCLFELALGDFPSARSLAEESIALARRYGSRNRLAHGLILLGQVFHGTGDTARAVELHGEALAIFREQGDNWGASYAAVNMRAVQRKRGDLIKAAALACIRFHWEHGDRQALLAAVENLARVRRSEHLERRVTLFAAARALGQALAPEGRPGQASSVEPFLTAAREHLGVERFSTLWEEGSAISYEEMVSLALEEDRSDLGAPSSGRPPSHALRAQALTAREREVASLVASGCNDLEIAERLCITHGTTRQYVHHILEKLGLRSRYEIAYVSGIRPDANVDDSGP